MTIPPVTERGVLGANAQQLRTDMSPARAWNVILCPPMKTLLVGVDDSEAARHAAKTAAELALPTGSSLTLVYVSTPILLPAAAYADVIDRLVADERKHASALLEREKAAVARPGLEVKLHHAEGAPAETFAALAEAPDVWMAVVGSRGRNAVTRVLLGSFADRVVHVCRKPVLVVR